MSPIKQAVILAGGPGLRLRPLTNDRPKPMVLVNNRPFLDYLIEDLLKPQGIEEVVLLLGYMPEKITDYVGDGSRYGIQVKYWIGTVTDGTGTRIREAKDLLADEFLLLYCDNYLNIDLNELYKFHKERNIPATVTVYSNKHGLTKNNIVVDEGGFVNKYDKSRQDQNMNGVDAGFFILKRDAILPLMPKENFFFELVVIPALIAEKKLAGFVTDRFYYSIGSPARLQETEQFLKPKKVIFLDRDGVINKRPPKGDWVKSWKEFEFLPGAIEAMKLLVDRGYKIYIISNQAGIARGALTPEVLHHEIHGNMEGELSRHGVKIDAIYYCPHGWDSPCECRKPKPGMFFQAALDHHIDLPKAVFIGDDERDGMAGKAAGVPTIILKPGESLLEAVTSMTKKPET